MKLALIENGSISAIAEHTYFFPNVSFAAEGPDADFLAANNAKEVKSYLDHDDASEKLVTTEPYIDGDFVYTVKVVALDDGDIQARADQQATNARSTRNGLLANTDWTQLADAKVDAAAWAAYRQELRDITKQPGFPASITWPADPDGNVNGIPKPAMS